LGFDPGRYQKKTKANLKHGATKPQPKTRPLHHGGTEARRKTKNKWVLFEPPIPGCIQNQGLDISAFSLQRKNEDTEVLNLPLLAGIRTMTQICAKKQEFRAW